VINYQTRTQHNPWQFASGYFDVTTGLYKFGTRYYIQPFAEEMDAAGPRGWHCANPNSGNPYVYAGNEPNMLTDPSGDFCIPGNALVAILLGGAALVFTLLAIFASPAVLITIFAIGLTGAQVYGAIAAVLTLQGVIDSFTISSAPVCFG